MTTIKKTSLQKEKELLESIVVVLQKHYHSNDNEKKNVRTSEFFSLSIFVRTFSGIMSEKKYFIEKNASNEILSLLFPRNCHKLQTYQWRIIKKI